MTDRHLEMVRITHEVNYYSVRRYTNIVLQGIDEVFQQYLSSIHLDRHQWFFNGLDYFQIISVHQGNILSMIDMVNRNDKRLRSINAADLKKICQFTKAMKHRSVKINALLEVIRYFSSMTFKLKI